jgi:hypothetical protein
MAFPSSSNCTGGCPAVNEHSLPTGDYCRCMYGILPRLGVRDRP